MHWINEDFGANLKRTLTFRVGLKDLGRTRKSVKNRNRSIGRWVKNWIDYWRKQTTQEKYQARIIKIDYSSLIKRGPKFGWHNDIKCQITSWI